MENKNILSKSELQSRFLKKWNLRKFISGQIQKLQLAGAEESTIKHKLNQIRKLNSEINHLDKLLRGLI
ncbi:MAG: hypothetical protein QY331_09100 [Melioribacteraceae bacterium]|nr:MAG: hypothetical protein QY331_09100 [Melioribacteraceae bacterium]